MLLKLAKIGQSDKAFLLTSEFCPQRVVCLCPGAMYMWKNIKKRGIKSEFKEICLKLATNGRSDKGFLTTSKVCPQGVFCPCPGATYIYKIIKNVYKIRFRRDHFETCNIWAKRKGLSVVIKFLSPMGCLPQVRGRPPQGTKFWCQQKPLVTLIICYKFKPEAHGPQHSPECTVLKAIFSQNTVNVACKKNSLSFAMATNQIEQFGLNSYSQRNITVKLLLKYL